MNNIPCAQCESISTGSRFKLLDLVGNKDQIFCSSCILGKTLDGVNYDMVLVDSNER
jgi:hypothetical protein